MPGQKTYSINEAYWNDFDEPVRAYAAVRGQSHGALVEQAGGVAAAGSRRILDLEPAALHQKTPVMLGSPNAMDALTRFLG